MLRHPWRLAAGVVLGLVVLFGAYTAWLVLRVEHSLTAAVHDADGLKAAMTSGETGQLTSRLDRLGDHSRSAAEHTDSWAWSLAEHFPVVGDDLRGVKVASHVVADLSDGDLDGLADAAQRLRELAPQGGRIDLDTVAQLQQPVATAAEQLAHARTRLGAEDTSGYAGALKTKFRSLERQVDDAATMLGSADRALQVMPSMLGQDGPKSYLLILQNNAEIRATGGLPGAVSLITADDGAIEMTKQVAGNSFGERAGGPVLPLSKDEVALFHQQLGTFFLDANLTPDFARAADLWKARWEEVEGGHIDGVLSIDPVTLSYLLKVTGPITVPGSDTTIDSDNVVDQLLHQTYLDYPDPADQDTFFRGVASAVFDKAIAGSRDPQRVIGGLAKGAAEHRVYVHDFDTAIQRHLDGTAVAGQFVTEAGDHPVVNVALNDSTGAKMSYYLRYQTQVSSDYCTNGVQGLTGKIHIASDAPKDAATLPDYITGGEEYGVPKGGQIVMMTVAGPVDGAVDNVLINGKPNEDVTLGTLDGRPTAQIFFFLTPGKTWDVSWRMRTGKGQTGSTQVDVTPSIVAGSASSTVPSACGA